MPVKDIKESVRGVVINAALAYELHDRKGEEWRLVFKRALNSLSVKAGREYKFLTLMAAQDRKSMDRVVRVLCGVG